MKYTKQQRIDNLEQLCTELHWMARRYADGRSTYAVEIVNSATDLMLMMGVKIVCCAEKKIYARDGMFGLNEIREAIELEYVEDNNAFSDGTEGIDPQG